MNRIAAILAGVIAVLALSTGTALATGVFNNDPPTSAGWMTRPCKDAPDDTTIKEQNCFWTTSMGTWTDANNNPITVGFWIRKMPGQPLICYFYSPDDVTPSSSDRCYSTTDSKAMFLRRTFALNN